MWPCVRGALGEKMVEGNERTTMSRMKAMRSLALRPSELPLVIEAGQVVCPRRGTVDIERCFPCRDYRGLEHSRAERLVCGTADGSDIFTPFGVIPM